MEDQGCGLVMNLVPASHLWVGHVASNPDVGRPALRLRCRGEDGNSVGADGGPHRCHRQPGRGRGNAARVSGRGGEGEGEIEDYDSSSAAPRGALGNRRTRWTTLGFLDVLGWEEIGRKNNLNQGRELQI